MQFLRLMGVSSDGSALIVVGSEGRQYRLALDDALRTAVRTSRPASTPTGSGLSLPPREIQARLRAGATAEDVADEAGVPVEKVRRYEGPILGERAHMAAQAQRAVVRRPAHTPATASTARTLGDVVTRRVDSEGCDAEGVAWDSWRRDDGRWIVQVTVPAEEPVPARWLFDPLSKAVVPADEAAAELLVERPPKPEPLSAVVHVLSTARDERPEPVAPRTAEQLTWPTPGTEQPSTPEPLPEKQAVGESRRSAGSRRPSVPAWDDILLGARRSE